MKLRLAKPARESIGARLRELRRFHDLDQTELARMAGLSQAIVSQYENGLTEVSLSVIAFLSDKFQISTEWLISGKPAASPHGDTGEASLTRKEGPAGGANRKGKTRYIQVPIVAPHVAAQPGAVRDDTIRGWYPVPSAQIHGRKNLVAVDIMAAWVKNMSPIFRPAPLAVIDRDDKTIHSNGYYAVNTKEGGNPSITAIRRLNRSGQRLWFLEDNPSASFEYVDLGSRFRLERVVVGRLVWICQPL